MSILVPSLSNTLACSQSSKIVPGQSNILVASLSNTVARCESSTPAPSLSSTVVPSSLSIAVPRSCCIAVQTPLNTVAHSLGGKRLLVQNGRGIKPSHGTNWFFETLQFQIKESCDDDGNGVGSFALLTVVAKTHLTLQSVQSKKWGRHTMEKHGATTQHRTKLLFGVDANLSSK